jgi:glycosyltransferase involved in cell wall biosynthesis
MRTSRSREDALTSDAATPGRLRVLMLVTARTEGGAERMAEESVRALCGRCDFTVVVASADSMRPFAARLSAHARVVPLPLERTTGLWPAAASVRRLARSADVVHLNSNHPASRLAAILSLAVGRTAPLVSVEQQASSPAAVRLPPGFAPWARLAFRVSRRRTAVVVAVSNDNARRLSQEYGIDAARIVTVYNGIDPRRFDVPLERRQARRRQLGLTADDRMVVVPARHAPNKGHRFLVSAARQVLDAMPRTRFVLAGEGRMGTDIRDAIERHGLRPAFLDLGLLPHEEMADTLAAADVLALPSLAEGFSVVLLEGMAAGVTPVATTVGGAAELIADGETGFLVPPGDADALARALVRALGLAPAARRILSARARERAASFSIDATARQMLEVYRRATGELRNRAVLR